VTVIGTPIETDLARPIIVEANGGILDPQLLTVTVDIRVYDGRDPFDLVTLILDGTYPNGDATTTNSTEALEPASYGSSSEWPQRRYRQAGRRLPQVPLPGDQCRRYTRITR